jgi:dTDP-4-dehydrorhamnose 3,5-epimerase
MFMRQGDQICAGYQMNVLETSLPGVLIVEPKVLGDSRGFFMELFHSERYAAGGIGQSFVQDNLSRSSQGVLRGLHLQSPNPQGKLVTVLRGAVLDVAVDVRLGSPTFGQHATFELNDDNRRQLWVPRGFAHGFVVLSETADVFYKCDRRYSPADEIVVRWDDPQLGIDWRCDAPKVSGRDQEGRRLAELAGVLPAYGSV